MSPKIGDEAHLRDVLLAAKRAHNFGEGEIDARLEQVSPLIEALQASLKQRSECRNIASDLMKTLKLVPIYATEPTMGSEPIAYRWIVYKYPEFHKVIERLRDEFPEVK